MFLTFFKNREHYICTRDCQNKRIEELRLVKKAAPYTEAEQAMIISDAQLGKSASEIAAEVNKEFHNDQSTNAISRQRKIPMGPDFESGHPEWSSSDLAQSPPDYCEFRGAHTNRYEIEGGADWFQKNSGCGGCSPQAYCSSDSCSLDWRGGRSADDRMRGP